MKRPNDREIAKKKIKYYDAAVQLTGDEVSDKKIDYSVCENRKVELKITLDWEFPKGWDDELINFNLNENGFCLGSLLDRVNEYAEQHNGCICFISKAQVLPKENIEETEKEASQ